MYCIVIELGWGCDNCANLLSLSLSHYSHIPMGVWLSGVSSPLPSPSPKNTPPPSTPDLVDKDQTYQQDKAE